MRNSYKHAVWWRVSRVDVVSTKRGDHIMVALIVLLVILAIFGGLGFAAHVLWFVLLIAVALWLLGFVIGGVDAGVGRRRWYGRW
jgi:hypothetical protein